MMYIICENEEIHKLFLNWKIIFKRDVQQILI